jgi:hypothetical protein
MSAELSKSTREQDLGAITSKVKVYNMQVAKLDVMSSKSGESLDYKINSLDNVTEVYYKGFDITIPVPNFRDSDSLERSYVSF